MEPLLPERGKYLISAHKNTNSKNKESLFNLIKCIYFKSQGTSEQILCVTDQAGHRSMKIDFIFLDDKRHREQQICFKSKKSPFYIE